MADSTKTYTTIFSILDRFSAGYAKIEKQIATLQDRTVTIPLELNPNSVARIDAIKSRLEGTFGAVQQSAKGAGQAADKSMGAAGGSVDNLTKKATGLKGAFGALKESGNQLNDSVGTLAASFAAMATGAGVAGLSWLDKAKDELSDLQSYAKFESSKKDKLSGEQVKAFTESFKESGWIRENEMLDIVNTVDLWGGKKVAGKQLDISSQAARVYFKSKESLDESGVNASEIARMAVRAGELRLYEKASFAAAVGVGTDDSKLKTAAGRQKLLAKQAASMTPEVMNEETAKRPWVVAENNIRNLKSAIGSSLGGPMMIVTGLAAKFIGIISKIPGLPGLIGMLAILTAMGGAFGILITTLAPVYTLLVAVKTAMFAQSVATAVLTTATVTDTTVTNLSSAARLRAAISHRIYQASLLFTSAASWAVVAATGALAAIYGILTGSITATTIATWLLNGAMAVLDALNPFTYIIAAGAIVVGILGYLAYRSGALSTIWKDLGKIWKDISTGKFDKILPDVTKMLGKIDLGAVFKFSGFGAIEYVLNYISRKLDDLFGITDVAGKATTYLLKTVTDILTWLWNTIKGLYSWLMHIIPGSGKIAAKDKWEKEMKKAGVEYKDGKYYSTDTQSPISTWDDALQKYKTFESGLGKEVTPPLSVLNAQTEYESEKGFVDTLLDKLKSAIPGGQKEAKRSEMEALAETMGLKFRASNNQFYNSAGVVAPSGKLADLFEEYKNLPGFADGIAQAVTKALESIDFGFPDFEEEFKPLTDALEILGKKLEEWGLGGGDSSTQVSTSTDATSGTVYGMDKKTNVFFKKDSVGNKIRVAEEEVPDEVKKDIGVGNARGITFTKSGFYAGKFHGPEETLSQASTIKGPGVIARALDALDGANRPMAAGVGSGDIHIHMPSQDFSGMRISSDLDVEKLMARIRKEMGDVAVESVKRALGQGRT